VKLRLQRWQCRNGACKRKTFTTQAPEVAAPRARRTARATEVAYLFGHGVGGRPGERLIKRIGMPMSDDTILRCLKRRVKARGSERKTRVAGVDDWAWRKGSTYGTIIVDLEQREVVDLFPERAAGMTADWFKKHPGVEIVSRDRCGSFSQGHKKARRRRGKSPTVFISCRICARPFRRNSAARQGFAHVLCCRRTAKRLPA
jgi:transposase